MGRAQANQNFAQDEPETIEEPKPTLWRTATLAHSSQWDRVLTAQSALAPIVAQKLHLEPNSRWPVRRGRTHMNLLRVKILG